MNLNEYQQQAKRTMPEVPTLENAVLGLCGESGEVADNLKKVMYQGHDFKNTKFIDELGDCLWYIALAAEALGTTMDVIAQYNITKLRTRYPQGFSADKSINRSI
jgi:NTP pyrophosphatase (non-canonical NTP hydrolase)